MQIHPEHSMHNCPSTGYRFNANVHAFKTSSFQKPQAPRTLHDCSAAQMPIPPKSTTSIANANSTGSWREKVLGLFDPALRDAEDMMLSLPYGDIREKTNTLATVLDERASSEPATAANRPSSGSRPSTKARRNGARRSMTRAGSESSNRGLASGVSSASRLAGRALHSQNCDSTVITKTLYVTSGSILDLHADRS
jgi:hypothetical protein